MHRSPREDWDDDDDPPPRSFLDRIKDSAAGWAEIQGKAMLDGIFNGVGLVVVFAVGFLICWGIASLVQWLSPVP